MSDPRELVNVRYLVDDVQASVDSYTEHLGFEARLNAAPAFADVVRAKLRLLLSGPTSSAGRPMADGEVPGPGGWNRIHLIVHDVDAEVRRLGEAGLRFRTRSSADRVARRSSWWTRRGTSSSSSSRRTPADRRSLLDIVQYSVVGRR